jgi:hypothetical protein
MPPPRSRSSDDYPSWLVESDNQEPDEQAGEKE